MRRALPRLVAAVAVALTGCASDTGAPVLSANPVASLPKLDLTPILSTEGTKLPVGTPTEVYTRVGRGLLTCWFGATGRLKPHYIYHADAQPPSKGGASVIDVFARDKTTKDPRALRAWRVGIKPGENSTVALDIENFKLPQPVADQLESDVRRWAATEEGCASVPTMAGWTSDVAKPPAATSKPTAKLDTKKKPNP